LDCLAGKGNVPIAECGLRIAECEIRNPRSEIRNHSVPGILGDDGVSGVIPGEGASALSAVAHGTVREWRLHVMGSTVEHPTPKPNVLHSCLHQPAPLFNSLITDYWLPITDYDQSLASFVAEIGDAPPDAY
jgi:hypothetical protein